MELPADFLSLGRGSVRDCIRLSFRSSRIPCKLDNCSLTTSER